MNHAGSSKKISASTPIVPKVTKAKYITTCFLGCCQASKSSGIVQFFQRSQYFLAMLRHTDLGEYFRYFSIRINDESCAVDSIVMASEIYFLAPDPILT